MRRNDGEVARAGRTKRDVPASFMLRGGRTDAARKKSQLKEV